MSELWSDERIETFKQLYSEGKTHSQLADAMGVTRSACIGKAHRLGLPARGKTPRRKAKCPSEPKEKVEVKRKEAGFQDRIQRWGSGNGLRIVSVPYFDEEIEKVASDLPADKIPLSQRRTVVDIKENECRWPYGDPQGKDFFFCGAKVKPGFSYCSRHCRIAFTGTERRS